MSLYNGDVKVAGSGSDVGTPVEYTPTVTAGSGTFTTVSATGQYIQVGKQVTVFFTVVITTAGTASLALSVSLPFTPSINCSGVARDGSANMCSVQAFAGSDNAAIWKYDHYTIIGSGKTIYGTLTYLID